MKILTKAMLAMCLFTACNQYDESYITDDILSEKKEFNEDDSNPFVSLEKAKETANTFFSTLPNKKGLTRSSTNTATVNTLNAEDSPAMYVFNYPEGGFVIVGASKNYLPILAYSDEGEFDLSSDIPEVKEWIDDTKNAVASSEELADSVKIKMRNSWENIDGAHKSSSVVREKATTRSGGDPSPAEIACYMRCEELMSQANSSGYPIGNDGWYFAPLSYARQAFEEAGFSAIYQNLCYSAEYNHSPINGSVIGWRICTIRRQVGPLLSTKWGQDSPYNKKCDGHVTGCGPIALAQVMNYYKYPKSLSLNGYDFDWSKIDIFPQYDSDNATLIRLVYDRTDTSVFFGIVYTTPGGMEDGIRSFGYNVSTSDDEDYQRVSQEIFGGKRPVIMLGNDDNFSVLPGSLSYIGNSHYWVCDGANERTENKLQLFTEWQPYGNGTFVPGWYSIDRPYEFGGSSYLYLHMNWGWYGYCNGWFIFNETNSGNAYSYDNQYMDNSGNGDFEHSRMNFYISRY
jgi:hypothetical protein